MKRKSGTDLRQFTAKLSSSFLSLPLLKRCYYLWLAATKLLLSKVGRACLIVAFFCGVSIWTDETLERTAKGIASNLFGNAESIAIGSAAVVFFLEIPDRKKRDHYEAWQVINSGLGQTGSGGRIQALEDLKKDEVDLEGIAAPRADLSGIDLGGARLKRANFEGTQLDESNLSRADLRGADLSKAFLSRADLNGADLNGAFLSRADLRGAKLNDADLRGAKLSAADLSAADLSTADLKGANLRGADLRIANLKGVDLRDANLRRVNVTNTPFVTVIGLSDEQKQDLIERGAIFYRRIHRRS